MADDETASDGAPRRKREAPTIDLTAKDLTPPAPEPSPAAAEAASETPPPEEPASAPAEATPEPPTPISLPEWTRVMGAGVAGGVIAAAVFGALWYGGALPPGKESSDASVQIAALQQQIDALRSRPAPQADTRTLDAVAQRVGKVEDAMKSLGVALTALNQRSDDASANAMRAREQADAAEKAVTQLRGSVQDAARDASSAVSPAQIDALTQRLAALDQASKSAHADIDKVVASEKATRLALSASALRTAVVTGASFAAELAQAKSLGAPERYLAPLSSFAASGVPSDAALAQELRGHLPQMVKLAGAQAPAGGFLERLQANASKLVKITPVDAPPGDDVSAVLARLEIAAAHADIAGALADLGKLPDAVRAPAQGFIDKAKARETALVSVRDLVADTMRALGSR